MDVDTFIRDVLQPYLCGQSASDVAKVTSQVLIKFLVVCLRNHFLLFLPRFVCALIFSFCKLRVQERFAQIVVDLF